MRKTRKGEPQIIKDRCKGCTYCVTLCPRNVLEMTSDFNKLGHHFPFVRYKEKCIACKICEYVCPDFAIYVIEK